MRCWTAHGIFCRAVAIWQPNHMVGSKSQKTGLPHLSLNTPAAATSPIPSRLLAKTRMETSRPYNISSFQLLVYGFHWHNGCSSWVAILIISCMTIIIIYPTCIWPAFSLQPVGLPQASSPILHFLSESNYAYRIFTAQIPLWFSSTVKESMFRCKTSGLA